jgi:hypothetical protein
MFTRIIGSRLRSPGDAVRGSTEGGGGEREEEGGLVGNRERERERRQRTEDEVSCLRARLPLTSSTAPIARSPPLV